MRRAPRHATRYDKTYALYGYRALDMAPRVTRRRYGRRRAIDAIVRHNIVDAVIRLLFYFATRRRLRRRYLVWWGSSFTISTCHIYCRYYERRYYDGAIYATR